MVPPEVALRAVAATARLAERHPVAAATARLVERHPAVGRPAGDRPAVGLREAAAMVRRVEHRPVAAAMVRPVERHQAVGLPAGGRPAVGLPVAAAMVRRVVEHHPVGDRPVVNRRVPRSSAASYHRPTTARSRWAQAQRASIQCPRLASVGTRS
jgi:hypothetical protein